jgi:CheY-like chemotaxis protein
VRIEADVPPLPLVRGSAAELAHVFGSLLLHAREQMPEGGQVQVKARVDRGRVLVTIRDAGGGMSEEDLARLFDPFSGVAGETALGLSVAWGVMSRLGGSLQAQSRPGEGTSFTLIFPLAAPPRHNPVQAPRGERHTRRILIVDDELDNLEVLREVLEMENQRVESVRSGPDAIDLFERGERFDLVLCDVGMPQMSGWQVAREIQRIAPGTQVWMLTGWANEIGEGDPRRRYVHGVLAKPLDLDQLRSLLATSPAPQPDVTTVH